MPEPRTPGRETAIDGLRGILAFGVFLCHVVVWYFLLHEGTWRAPPSPLYVHLGQSSVAMFFMITAYLFWSRLLAHRNSSIDWTRLYVSRVMRLTPLYLFAMAALFLFVSVASGFALRESQVEVLNQALRWLTFTMLSAPPINHVLDTYAMTAAVTWTLRYEWVFYLMLPLGALALGSRVRWPTVVIGLLALAFCFVARLQWIHFAAFGVGVIAAHVAKRPAWRAFAARPVASVIAIVCAVFAVWWSPGGNRLSSLCLFGAAFVLVAAGTTLFGFLRLAALRLLGDMSYSIYLLHGLLLYCVFVFVIGKEATRELSVVGHWSVAAVCTPVLVTLCYCTYRFIELPGMAATPQVHAKVLALWKWLGSRGAALPGR
jgi:peptidoglycan/LPS O-acetylase OafA/YrhL